ncbi:DUF2252 domain-containing protein [Arthrobacter sp. YN]|uniref:DUF2252 domain-containing protein n=1 Tax=Arthrobacter sp. YN TaxID=2020486 RepID=UPI000B5FFDEC|nr:DUF2252 domain-containing protein [Arthrobacter sp. YN]ASN20170.1 hypothetical protein CGK93_11195 [Arthrobacter sp. YN]
MKGSTSSESHKRPNLSPQARELHSGSLSRAKAAGKAARGTMPRRDHAAFKPEPRDAVEILEGQHASRLPELVPVRIGRMLESPFAFYRGAAAIMAKDLSHAPVTGHTVLACGDAHLSNYGFFASPERRLIFDLNDFDEAFPAPWEWDIKRLAASVWVNGRNDSHSEEQCRTATQACLRRYREALQQLYQHTAVERYFFHVDADLLRSTKAMRGRHVKSAGEKARQRTSEQTLAKLTRETEAGNPRIVDQPPIVRHPEVMDLPQMENLVSLYRTTLRADTALLMSQFRLVDYALRIVGVGSVGRRNWVLLFEGPAGEPLFLQAKEAGPSVLESHGGAGHHPERIVETLAKGEGARVVGAQRILQAQSDPFLGWISDVKGSDGLLRDFYIRQFRDMKGSFILSDLKPRETADYAGLCGWMLARAHSQSAGSAFIPGYLGKGEAFDEAITSWAKRYADQTEHDYEQLQQAVRSGRMTAQMGV